MIKENQKLLNKLNTAIDGLMIFVSMPLAYWIRFTFFGATEHRLAFDYYLVAVVILVVVQLFSYKFFGIYDTNRKDRFLKEVSKGTIINTFVFSMLLTTFFVLKITDFSRGVLAAFFVMENLALISKRVAVRLFLRHIRRKGYNQKSIIVVGSGELAKSCKLELKNSPELGYQVLGYIGAYTEEMVGIRLGSLYEIDRLLKKYNPDEVIAALEVDEYSALPAVIQACEKNGIRFSLVPCYAKYLPIRPQVDSLNGIPLLNLRAIPLDNMANAFIKRSMDIVGSLLLIVLTSPLMLVAAIGVKLSSPGPIIFRQERVGYGNRTFYMYKFRSMRVNSSENTGWSTNSDPRRTRFGSFIRKYSIDELPQFFNVLKGDMSLVGPRPELPHFVEHFRDEIPMYMVKHQVRPGITGWAQVHGLRGDTSIEKRIRHDLFYIENWSPMMDIQIMIMTLWHAKNEEEVMV
ncbi:MAG: undecaprenyl-phosphate glucose phosphotransferase [Oscillospiraceae bacterium]|nr:undecaprenyl-phosphate glucose phosphotransferase [Oscillospiraceae bacterium]